MPQHRCFCQGGTAESGKPDSVRLYSTPSEQREAGLKHQLTPWLTAGGLAELEWTYDKVGFSNHHSNRSDADKTANIQLSATAMPWSFAKGDLVPDYDTDTDRLEVDEAVVSLEHRPGNAPTAASTCLSEFTSVTSPPAPFFRSSAPFRVKVSRSRESRMFQIMSCGLPRSAAIWRARRLVTCLSRKAR